MIKNITRQTIIATHVDIADHAWTRMKGLLGRADLPQNHALVITHCNSIHMMFMAFAIDVIFIDKNNHVVGLTAHIPPFAFSPIFWKSTCAIELPPGTIQATQTHVGDSIQIG